MIHVVLGSSSFLCLRLIEGCLLTACLVVEHGIIVLLPLFCCDIHELCLHMLNANLLGLELIIDDDITDDIACVEMGFILSANRLVLCGAYFTCFCVVPTLVYTNITVVSIW